MSLPTKIGVYGGGRMGAGIAHTYLLAGSSVVVVEADDVRAGAAAQRVATSVAKAAELGAVTTSTDEVLARLSTITDPAGLAGCELVIEAVSELISLKLDVLREAERVCGEAWLATNTSSLPVGELAAGLRRPERLVGLHFFNPVPASDLVEIVVGAETAPELVSAAQEWVEALGKRAITVTDSPGFASSRLGVAIALEAIRMLESGVASAEDIDTAMTLGYRHPLGPLRTTDLVGLDVRLAIAEHLATEFGDRFVPPQLLRDLVASGRLGRKSGEGFFSW